MPETPTPLPTHELPAVEAYPELSNAPALKYGRLEELNDRHKMIAQMEVMGYKIKDIATEMQVHPTTIYMVKNSPVYRVYVSDLRKQIEEKSVFDVAHYLETMTEETFRTMADLMRSAESENVRADMVKEFAARQSPKITKSEHKEETVINFGDSIQNLATALADNMRVDPRRLEGKSDEGIVELLEEEINAKNIRSDSDSIAD